jgi:hypothetical protein
MTAFTDSSNYQNHEVQGGRGGRGKLFYLLLGGGIGAMAALLFAPKSGTDLRDEISDVTQTGYGKTVEFSKRLKEKSATLSNPLAGSGDTELGALDTSSPLGKIEDRPSYSGSNGEGRTGNETYDPLNID